MNVTKFLKHVEKYSIDNSPVILTVVGVVGTVATAVLTHKAALRVQPILDDINFNHQTPTRKVKAQAVWKFYAPPVAMGTVTVASIVCANRIGTKRAAALAAAYTISERAFDEYREKVQKHMGDRGIEKIRDDIARDYVANNPPQESNIVMVGSGDVLCCDLYSGRYFRSSVEEIKKAVNDTNYQIMHGQYASLTDFYERIGLPRTDVSEEMGWNVDKLMEVEFSTVLSEDGQPCVAYRFQVKPIRRFHHIHG